MHSKAHERPGEEHAPRDRWHPARYSRQELADALVAARIAGPITSHDRGNVSWKIKQLVAGDPRAQFGLSGLTGIFADEVLQLLAVETGFDPDPSLRDGPSSIDPDRVLLALEAAGRRLARAADRGERVVLATGHPAGLPLLYMAVGDILENAGAKLLRPADGVNWTEEGHTRQIRYFHGVAVLTDRGSTLHTHAPGPMELMLERERPDLVFADHGFAGAAIEAGIETISIADVNDPAPIVAKSQGRTQLVIVMDDNVQPEDYWPCFQAIAATFGS
jgi:histidinol phosphate phosphatase hisN-like protein